MLGSKKKKYLFSDLCVIQFACMDWIPVSRFLQLALLLALPLNKNGPPWSALSNFSTVVWKSRQCCWLYRMLSLSCPPSANQFFQSSWKMPSTCIQTQPEVSTNIVFHVILGLCITHTCNLQLIYTVIFFNISSGHFITVYSQIRKLSYPNSKTEVNCSFDTFSMIVCMSLFFP